jgi:hypothetical protein
LIINIESTAEDLDKLSEFEMNWVWECLLKYPQLITLPVLTDPTKTLMLNALKSIFLRCNHSQLQTIINSIQESYNDFFINEKFFEEINRSELYLILCIFQYCLDVQAIFKQKALDTSTLKHELGYSFNRLPTTANSKKQEILRVKKYCKDLMTSGHLKRINWLDCNDKVQLEWAVTYLKTKRTLIEWFIPSNTKDTYNLVIASLLMLYKKHNHPAEQQIFISTMKKTWQQKAYRDKNSNYKSTYAPMTKETKMMLKELAESRGMKIQDVLEQAITHVAQHPYLINQT